LPVLPKKTSSKSRLKNHPFCRSISLNGFVGDKKEEKEQELFSKKCQKMGLGG
jgi:hypothetical protein